MIEDFISLEVARARFIIHQVKALNIISSDYHSLSYQIVQIVMYVECDCGVVDNSR